MIDIPELVDKQRLFFSVQTLQAELKNATFTFNGKRFPQPPAPLFYRWK
jgi:hypothetical protein